MIKVGLTGGIGAGKTTVSHIFKVLDIAVFNADVIAKQIMTTNDIVRQKLIDEFGVNSYINNELNKKYIAQIVFNNAAALHKLNSIVHPATIHAFTNWAMQQTTIYIIKEAALLFEANTYQDIDFIIGVFAPQELRLQNVMQRDNISQEEVLKRMANQMPDDDKIKRCNAVIYNNEQQSLIKQVLQVHKQILEKYIAAQQ